MRTRDGWDAALVHRDGVLTDRVEIGWRRTDVHRAVAPLPER